MSGFNWKDLGSSIADVAPALGLALGPVGAGLGSIIASVFGTDNDPAKINEAIKADPESQIKLLKIQTDHEKELTRIILAAETKKLTQVNETMRAEYGQDDPYVKRWRPTFGYAVCLTWTFQSFAIVIGTLYAIIGEPEKAPQIIEAIGSMVGALGLQWGVALSVLGVSVASRSKDKMVSKGMNPSSGILGSIVKGFRKNG